MTARPSASPPRPTPEERSSYPHLREMTTRWRDNDVYGHMNNVVYYEYFDTVVNAWLIDKTLLQIETSPVIGLVVETACSYFEPLGFPESVTAGLRAARVGGSSVTYEIALFRGAAEQAAAQGRFTHVYVDRASRRPRPLSEPMRAALATIEG